MKRLINIRYLFSHAWKISKSYIFIMAAKSIFSAFIPLVNIAGLGLVINALVNSEPERTILRLIIIYLSLNLAIAIISEILSLLDIIVQRKVSNLIQFDYMRNCINIDYHFVQDGSILDMKMKSMGAHPIFFLPKIGMFLNNMVQFAGVIYIFSILSPLFILILVLTSILSIALTFKTRKIDFEFKNARVEEDRKLDYLYNIMSGYKYAKEVRLNKADSFIENKYSGILKVQIEKLKAYYHKNLKLSIFAVIITIIQTAAMYSYFSYQVAISQITIAEYTVLLGATTLLASILIGFFDNLSQIDNTCKYVDLFREYKWNIEINSSITASNKLGDKDKDKYENIDFGNAVIRFENVSFKYPDTGKVILRNINIEIKKGEKIGIVGLNGSGKTTFIKLLTRIYDPTEGRITLNGIDNKEIPYLRYISHIGIVLQDFLLFAYSVKENIVFDKEYDESRFNKSIEKSGLGIKMANLKDGADTVIYRELDDNGIEFSGGEGQKLALARAIYKNADVLVLDEPTSTLDPIAEYELFSKLSDIADNKTAIFISHRLSSTRFCDRIIVLSGSEISECGSHIELIGKNGVYAKLFKAQAKYYEERGVALE